MSEPEVPFAKQEVPQIEQEMPQNEQEACKVLHWGYRETWAHQKSVYP